MSETLYQLGAWLVELFLKQHLPLKRSVCTTSNTFFAPLETCSGPWRDMLYLVISNLFNVVKLWNILT